MGVKELLPLLRPIERLINYQTLASKSICVDGYFLLHKAISACRDPALAFSTTNKYDPNSPQWLKYLINMLFDPFSALGIDIIVVFDGMKTFGKKVEENRSEKRTQQYQDGWGMLSEFIYDKVRDSGVGVIDRKAKGFDFGGQGENNKNNQKNQNNTTFSTKKSKDSRKTPEQEIESKFVSCIDVQFDMALELINYLGKNFEQKFDCYQFRPEPTTSIDPPQSTHQSTPQNAPELPYRFTPTVLGQQGTVDWIIAPYEADSQLVYLVRSGYCYAAMAEDSDLIALGCPVLLTKNNFHERTSICIELDKIFLDRKSVFYGWNLLKLQYYAILVGCDYTDGVNKVGKEKARQLISQKECLCKMIQIGDITLSTKSYQRDVLIQQIGEMNGKCKGEFFQSEKNLRWSFLGYQTKMGLFSLFGYFQKFNLGPNWRKNDEKRGLKSDNFGTFFSGLFCDNNQSDGVGTNPIHQRFDSIVKNEIMYRFKKSLMNGSKNVKMLLSNVDKQIQRNQQSQKIQHNNPKNAQKHQTQSPSPPISTPHSHSGNLIGGDLSIHSDIISDYNRQERLEELFYALLMFNYQYIYQINPIEIDTDANHPVNDNSPHPPNIPRKKQLVYLTMTHLNPLPPQLLLAYYQNDNNCSNLDQSRPNTSKNTPRNQSSRPNNLLSPLIPTNPLLPDLPQPSPNILDSELSIIVPVQTHISMNDHGDDLDTSSTPKDISGSISPISPISRQQTLDLTPNVSISPSLLKPLHSSQLFPSTDRSSSRYSFSMVLYKAFLNIFSALTSVQRILPFEILPRLYLHQSDALRKYRDYVTAGWGVFYERFRIGFVQLLVKEFIYKIIVKQIQNKNLVEFRDFSKFDNFLLLEKEGIESPISPSKGDNILPRISSIAETAPEFCHDDVLSSFFSSFQVQKIVFNFFPIIFKFFQNLQHFETFFSENNTSEGKRTANSPQIDNPVDQYYAIFNKLADYIDQAYNTEYYQQNNGQSINPRFENYPFNFEHFNQNQTQNNNSPSEFPPPTNNPNIPNPILSLLFSSFVSTHFSNLGTQLFSHDILVQAYPSLFRAVKDSQSQLQTTFFYFLNHLSKPYPLTANEMMLLRQYIGHQGQNGDSNKEKQKGEKKTKCEDNPHLSPSPSLQSQPFPNPALPSLSPYFYTGSILDLAHPSETLWLSQLSFLFQKKDDIFSPKIPHICEIIKSLCPCCSIPRNDTNGVSRGDSSSSSNGVFLTQSQDSISSQRAHSPSAALPNNENGHYTSSNTLQTPHLTNSVLFVPYQLELPYNLLNPRSNDEAVIKDRGRNFGINSNSLQEGDMCDSAMVSPKGHRSHSNRLCHRTDKPLLECKFTEDFTKNNIDGLHYDGIDIDFENNFLDENYQNQSNYSNLANGGIFTPHKHQQATHQEDYHVKYLTSPRIVSPRILNQNSPIYLLSSPTPTIQSPPMNNHTDIQNDGIYNHNTNDNDVIFSSPNNNPRNSPLQSTPLLKSPSYAYPNGPIYPPGSPTQFGRPSHNQNSIYMVENLEKSITIFSPLIGLPHSQIHAQHALLGIVPIQKVTRYFERSRSLTNRIQTMGKMGEVGFGEIEHQKEYYDLGRVDQQNERHGKVQHISSDSNNKKGEMALNETFNSSEIKSEHLHRINNGAHFEENLDQIEETTHVMSRNNHNSNIIGSSKKIVHSANSYLFEDVLDDFACDTSTSTPKSTRMSGPMQKFISSSTKETNKNKSKGYSVSDLFSTLDDGNNDGWQKTKGSQLLEYEKNTARLKELKLKMKTSSPKKSNRVSGKSPKKTPPRTHLGVESFDLEAVDLCDVGDTKDNVNGQGGGDNIGLKSDRSTAVLKSTKIASITKEPKVFHYSKPRSFLLKLQHVLSSSSSSSSEPPFNSSYNNMTSILTSITAPLSSPLPSLLNLLSGYKKKQKSQGGVTHGKSHHDEHFSKLKKITTNCVICRDAKYVLNTKLSLSTDYFPLPSHVQSLSFPFPDRVCKAEEIETRSDSGEEYASDLLSAHLTSRFIHLPVQFDQFCRNLDVTLTKSPCKCLMFEYYNSLNKSNSNTIFQEIKASFAKQNSLFLSENPQTNHTSSPPIGNLHPPNGKPDESTKNPSHITPSLPLTPIFDVLKINNDLLDSLLTWFSPPTQAQSNRNHNSNTIKRPNVYQHPLSYIEFPLGTFMNNDGNENCGLLLKSPYKLPEHLSTPFILGLFNDMCVVEKRIDSSGENNNVLNSLQDQIIQLDLDNRVQSSQYHLFSTPPHISALLSPFNHILFQLPIQLYFLYCKVYPRNIEGNHNFLTFYNILPIWALLNLNLKPDIIFKTLHYIDYLLQTASNNNKIKYLVHNILGGIDEQASVNQICDENHSDELNSFIFTKNQPKLFKYRNIMTQIIQLEQFKSRPNDPIVNNSVLNVLKEISQSFQKREIEQNDENNCDKNNQSLESFFPRLKNSFLKSNSSRGSILHKSKSAWVKETELKQEATKLATTNPLLMAKSTHEGLVLVENNGNNSIPTTLTVISNTICSSLNGFGLSDGSAVKNLPVNQQVDQNNSSSQLRGSFNNLPQVRSPTQYFTKVTTTVTIRPQKLPHVDSNDDSDPFLTQTPTKPQGSIKNNVSISSFSKGEKNTTMNFSNSNAAKRSEGKNPKKFQDNDISALISDDDGDDFEDLFDTPVREKRDSRKLHKDGLIDVEKFNTGEDVFNNEQNDQVENNGAEKNGIEKNDPQFSTPKFKNLLSFHRGSKPTTSSSTKTTFPIVNLPTDPTTLADNHAFIDSDVKNLDDFTYEEIEQPPAIFSPTHGSNSSAKKTKNATQQIAKPLPVHNPLKALFGKSPLHTTTTRPYSALSTKPTASISIKTPVQNDYSAGAVLPSLSCEQPLSISTEHLARSETIGQTLMVSSTSTPAPTSTSFAISEQMVTDLPAVILPNPHSSTRNSPLNAESFRDSSKGSRSAPRLEERAETKSFRDYPTNIKVTEASSEMIDDGVDIQSGASGEITRQTCHVDPTWSRLSPQLISLLEPRSVSRDEAASTIPQKKNSILDFLGSNKANRVDQNSKNAQFHFQNFERFSQKHELNRNNTSKNSFDIFKKKQPQSIHSIGNLNLITQTQSGRENSKHFVDHGGVISLCSQETTEADTPLVDNSAQPDLAPIAGDRANVGIIDSLSRYDPNSDDVDVDHVAKRPRYE